METNSNSNDKDNLTYNIMQFIIFLIMIFLIVFRCFNYDKDQNSWIWIVSYIGMEIAFINLFINKCFSLKNKQHKKYKPFVGFTIFIIFISLFISIPVYKAQKAGLSQFTNDLLTLFALFFSLSHIVWNFFLNLIIKTLKV